MRCVNACTCSTIGAARVMSVTGTWATNHPLLVHEDEAAGQMGQDCLIGCQGCAADDEALRAHERQAAQIYEQRAPAWWRFAESPIRR
jgi:hypothetical protein